MKILVATMLPEFARAELNNLGVDVDYQPQLVSDDLIDHIAGVSILIVGRSHVSAETIQACETLQLIVRNGSDASNIAIEAASDAGVFVTHCPSKDVTAITELAFALLLALDRRIPEHSDAIVAGRFKREQAPRGLGLSGRTLGLIGLGDAAYEIAIRARAFGMHVLAWSATATPELNDESLFELCTWPRDIARRSDFVVTCLPPEQQDQLYIDATFVQNMTPSAALVHIGHPAAIDQAALAEAVEDRDLRVAVDLFTSDVAADSIRMKSKLFSLPGVIGTYQLAGRTEQARTAAAHETLRIVREFVVAGEVVNCLNLLERSPATWQLVLRLRDTVGVLASVMNAVQADGVNAEEVTCRVFVGARAAWCAIALDERPSTDGLNAIRALPGVLHLELRAVV